MRHLKTGLAKVCPRCGRIGEVWLVAETRSFEIDWPRRVTARIGKHKPDPVRHDTCLDLADLLSPGMGCGYDDVQRRGAA